MPIHWPKSLGKRSVQLLAMKVLPGAQRTGCEPEPGIHKGDKEISHESGPWSPPNIFLRHEDIPPPQTYNTIPRTPRVDPPVKASPSPPYRLQRCLLLPGLRAQDPSLLSLHPFMDLTERDLLSGFLQA